MHKLIRSWLDKNRRIVLLAQFSLLFNLMAALGHALLGLLIPSAWYLILGAYYAILAVMRFGTVRYRGDERFIQRFCGWMLVALAFVLAETVIMGHFFDKAVRHRPVIMIALAAWTSVKFTLAVVNVVRIRSNPSPRLRTIRNISCAAAAVSVVTLQRSMIATFGGMPGASLMNDLTGSAACIFVLLLGLNMAMHGGLWRRFKRR